MKRNPIIVTEYLIEKAKRKQPKVTGYYVSIRSVVEEWEHYKANHK